MINVQQLAALRQLGPAPSQETLLLHWEADRLTGLLHTSRPSLDHSVFATLVHLRPEDSSLPSTWTLAGSST